MTDEKKYATRMQSNSTSFPEPEQIRKQAERKVQSIQQPDFSSMTLEEIQKQFHELQVKQIEAGLQIEQLRSYSEERDEQAKLLSIVAENMLDMVSLTDMEGNFLFAGKSHKILGYEPGFLIGKNVMDFVHPEDRSRILKEFGEAVALGHPRIVEYRYRCEDGTYLWLETLENFITDGNGNPQKIMFSSRDITMRKQAETDVRKSEQTLKDIFESTLSGYWDWNLSDNTEYLSPTFKRMFGYEDHEMESSPESWQRIIFQEDLPGVLEVFDRHIKSRGREPFYNEIRYRHRYGSTVWVICTGRVIEWAEDGTAIRMVGCHIDITDRKRAEEENRIFRIISDNAVYGKAIVDLQGHLLYVNRFFADIHGYEPEQLIGKHYSLFHSREQTEAADRLIASTIREGRFEPTTVWHHHQDGTEFPMLMSGVLIKDQTGEPQCINASAIDLTEFYRTQQDYQTLFHEMLNGFALHEIICDTAGAPVDYRFLSVNPSFERMTGMAAEDITGRTVQEILPGTEPYWIETYGGVALNGEPVFFENYSAEMKKFFEVNAFSPAPNQFACIFQDITERKQAEKALRQINETLEQQVAERTELAETRARQLQALAVELIEAEERERQRIAELLHDDLQQMLASARFQLQSASVNLQNNPILASVNEILEESIAKSRKLSHELSPPILYHGSLYSALEWLGRQMKEQFGFTIELKDEKSPNLENTPLKMFLFRAVQEILFNIVKHAGVKSARVSISGSNDNIAVTVTDQGKGFSKDSTFGV